MEYRFLPLMLFPINSVVDKEQPSSVSVQLLTKQRPLLCIFEVSVIVLQIKF